MDLTRSCRSSAVMAEVVVDELVPEPGSDDVPHPVDPIKAAATTAAMAHARCLVVTS
ncbi:hypothetical protein [Nocardia sp. NPDC052316]|uniref:hypothetical protein n=1 Tax=Nocardia sp. NPDC052316 TaxID=3364329 RepID=UPI0037C8BD36